MKATLEKLKFHEKTLHSYSLVEKKITETSYHEMTKELENKSI